MIRLIKKYKCTLGGLCIALLGVWISGWEFERGFDAVGVYSIVLFVAFMGSVGDVT